MNKFKTSLTIFCLLGLILNNTAYGAVFNKSNKAKPKKQNNVIEENVNKDKNDQDVGKSIFKKNKAKKIKVKRENTKRQYKIDTKTQNSYSIPTDIYMNVGEKSDKAVKLSGGITKSVELNLADCLELALINSPKIKSAYAKTEIAKYQKWETLAGYTPTLDWQSSINRTMPDLSMMRSIPMTISAYNKYTAGSIGIKQLVWDFGYTQNKYTIDKIAYEKSKSDMDKVVNEVVCAVKDAYYNLLFAFDKKKVAQDTLDSFTQTYYQAQAYYEVGSKTKVDLLFAQTNMEDARQQLISAENNVDIAYAQLNNAMGLPFVDPYSIDTSLKYEPVAITMKEAVDIANVNRPDIKGVMLAVDSANQAVKLSWKTFLPSLEVQANYARGGVDNWTDREWYNYGGFLTFPAVNPVLIRNQIKEAKAQYEQVQYDAKAQINDIYYEIQNVYTRLKDAKARIPVAKTAMDKAQENYELTSGRYKVGYGDVIELKDAQVALSQAKLTYFQTIYDYNSARANLEKSIGQTLKPQTSEIIEENQEL